MEIEFVREKYAIIEKVEENLLKIMRRRDKALFLLQQRQLQTDCDFQSSVLEPFMFFLVRELCPFSEKLAHLQEIMIVPEENKLLFVFEYQPLLLSDSLFIEFLSPSQKNFIMFELATLLRGLHQEGILLVGLSPQNILVSKYCDVKLMSLQMAIKLVDDTVSLKVNEHRLIYNFDNLPDSSAKFYLAPEVLLGGYSVSRSADVWSFAVICCELLTHEPLFHGSSFLSQLELLVNFLGSPSDRDLEQLKIPSTSRHMLSLITNSFFATFEPRKTHILSKIKDKEIQGLLSRALSFDPTLRPAFEEIVNCQFFKEFSKKDQYGQKDNLRLNDLVFDLFLDGLAVPKSSGIFQQEKKPQTFKLLKKLRFPLCFLIINVIKQTDFWKTCYDDGDFRIISSKFIDQLRVVINKKFNFQDKNKMKVKINIFGLEIFKDPRTGKGMQIKLEDK
jgi:serine/threonine protein kinase